MANVQVLAMVLKGSRRCEKLVCILQEKDKGARTLLIRPFLVRGHQTMFLVLEWENEKRQVHDRHPARYHVQIQA